MMKTEPRGPGGPLRSASPHRSAYEAGIQALKPPDAPGPDEAPKAAHHKKYGSNVHRIKSMFLQMGTTAGPPGEAGGGAGPSEAPRAPERGVRLSLPRASSLNENVDHSALLKLGTSVSERVSRFDSKPAPSAQPVPPPHPPSRLQETRKLFERSAPAAAGGDKEAAARRLLRQERAGLQDRKLDVVVRFNGSTEALDKLDADAVSPTVSQLSAVFEKADSRTGLHRGPGLPRAAAAGAPQVNSKLVSKRSRVFQPPPPPPAPSGDAPAEKERGPGGQQPPQHRVAPARPPPKPREVRKIKPVEVEESGESEAEAAPGEVIQAEVTVHAALENGSTLATTASPAPEEQKAQAALEEAAAAAATLAAPERGVGNGRAPDVAPEEADESKKEDFSEADLVDVSAYSGLGEDSGGSALEEDDDEDEEDGEPPYEPESGCVEIPGLSEEEDPAPSRKIHFSTAPIQVSEPPSRPRAAPATCAPSPPPRQPAGFGRLSQPLPPSPLPRSYHPEGGVGEFQLFVRGGRFSGLRLGVACPDLPSGSPACCPAQRSGPTRPAPRKSWGTCFLVLSQTFFLQKLEWVVGRGVCVCVLRKVSPHWSLLHSGREGSAELRNTPCFPRIGAA